jgi:hypothetical protein
MALRKRITKARKSEKTKEHLFFVLSLFRVFVIAFDCRRKKARNGFALDDSIMIADAREPARLPSFPPATRQWRMIE